jgi:hypothetical protein
MTQDEIIAMAREVGFKMENSAAIQAAKAFYKLATAKERNFCPRCGKRLGGIDSIHTCTPPPPEQEPVAWRNAAIRVGEGLCSVGPLEYYDMTAKQWLDWALSVVTVHTAPPQRTWVGLAKEDRLCAKYMQDAPDGIEAVIDYIEAKLKEKNT